MNRSLALTFIAATHVALPIQAQRQLFADTALWSVSGDASGFRTEQGETTLALRGFASLDQFEFENGVITFDVRLTGRPAFVGLQFRAGQDGAEHVYVRPHRSGEWDAIQYQPLMHGSTTWQLHRGDGYTGAVELRPGAWTQVRLDVRGDKAELFVGERHEPAMRIQLERGRTGGAIAFTSGFRGEAPPHEIPGAFRRLVIDRDSDRPPFAWAVSPSTDESFIRTWRVSNPYQLTSVPATHVPDSLEHWSTIVAEPRGLVNLNRHYARISDANVSAVVARKEIVATTDDVVIPMQFDFSDHASVFLNGRLIFSGVNGWESRYPFYLGVLDPENVLNTVWLHLERGTNQLELVVSESAFGWGFVAKTGSVPGVTWR